MSDVLQRKIIQAQRNSTRQKQLQGDQPAPRPSCPDCHDEAPPDLDAFRAHVRADASRHNRLKDDVDIEKAFEAITLKQQA